MKKILASYYEGKNSPKEIQQSMISKVQFQTATIYKIITIFYFSYLYLCLAGNISVYTPNQGTNREKQLNHTIHKKNMTTLTGNKHPSCHFFLHGPRLFPLSTEKVRVRSVGNGNQSGYSRADTINNNINKR